MQKKGFLQKVAGVCSIVSFFMAVVCGAILLFNPEETEVFRASFGATTFFFAVVGVVLRTMATSNLPDLSMPKGEENHSDSGNYK